MELNRIHKPAWLRTSLAAGEHLKEVRSVLETLHLHTVCQEAACPNVGECWGRGTATFLILGETCTRNCRFCDVRSGEPRPPDASEPKRIAQAVQALSLRYCVVTSPTRDDLADGGAGHFADTVETIRAACAETLVEILIPDLQGDRFSIQSVVRSRPDVIAHNVETVARLTPAVRDHRTSYERSLAVLRTIKECGPDTSTKSGFMLGLGEQEEEILETMFDLRQAGCDVLTIGQYLRPSRECIPVVEYISPEQFETYRRAGAEMGFRSVASGPLVRSSYQAEEAFAAASKPTRQMQSAK